MSLAGLSAIDRNESTVYRVLIHFFRFALVFPRPSFARVCCPNVSCSIFIKTIEIVFRMVEMYCTVFDILSQKYPKEKINYLKNDFKN